VLVHWPFYLAFNLFRLAGIAQGIVKRALEGTASNARAMDNRQLVAPLANAGWAAAQRAA
jgi:aminoglycoside phosphotransferase (APT) family kinase protein